MTQLFADNGGKEMYLKYCAACHATKQGTSGNRSEGSDLTLLRSQNKGAYPLDRVMSSIDGSRAVRAHGTRNMPVWGEVFRQEHEKEKYTELTSLLKAKVIAEYVDTLQK